MILWGEPGEYGLCGVPLGIRGSRADFPQDISCPRCEKLWNTFYAQKKEPRDITRERRFRAIRKKCSAARKADMKALGKRLSLF